MDNSTGNIIEAELIGPEITLGAEPVAVGKSRSGVKLTSVINIAVFVIILIGGGIASILMPRKPVSEAEKRQLAQLPEFSWDNLFHGKYTQKLEDSYADNFPYRDPMVGFS